MATVYLKHRVSAEEKAKHRSKGDKILDIRFKPEEKPKPKRKKKTEE
ncbi:MAG: hypothetical protein ACPH3C_07100 [Glaciecola sp.]